MGLFGPAADAAQKASPGTAGSDTGMATSAANANPARNGPKEKGPKKQGPFATLSGVVTNSLTGSGVAGVGVTFNATSVSYSTVTDATGAFSEKLPVATYDVSFEAAYFQPQSSAASLVKGVTTTLNVALVPVAPVIVSASASDAAAPGVLLNAMGSWKIMDGSSFVSATWSQTEGAPATIDAAPVAGGDEGDAYADVMLPGAGVFKDELIHLLKEPPVEADLLPPNVEVPPGEFVGGLQDRFQVVAVNHLALERAGHVALRFAVATSSGTYYAPVDVHAELDWRANPGLHNVPVNVPVLLHGKTQGSWDWVLTSVPSGSAASLVDADTQNPEFTPDVSGIYVITENTSGEVLQVHAGTWRGIIVGQDLDGRPVADEDCTICHKAPPDGLGIAPDKFTPWAQTGHAEIFTNNLNTNSHYGDQCFGCHTVGFDPRAVNGGVDDAFDYDAFLALGLLSSPSPSNWTTMLASTPDSAQLANIQCENCHGPQTGSAAHMGVSGDPRVSLSSEVCASCHGEPLRHARFQQWQLSRHANYELAVDEGQSGNCSRCHTSNGFLTWLPVLTGEVPGDPTGSISVSWTEDETHPQTCVTCHDPHAAGTTSGIGTNAPVRISDNTPPLVAGFQAFGVGRGAMCMTCHNSRRGLRNDATWATTTDRDRAPHGSVHTDLLMGQNAYFVEVGNRGNHSFVEDTCVNCHMEKTPPPAVLSYNEGGTNHTFFARLDICSECHGEGFTAAGVQAGITSELNVLEVLIEGRYIDLIEGLLVLGNSVDLDGQATITAPGQILGISISESHGRQALVFELDSGTFGPVSLTAVDVVGPSGPATLFDFTDDVVLKATWNWILVHNDRGKGVHNPAFSTKVLEAAIAQLL